MREEQIFRVILGGVCLLTLDWWLMRLFCVAADPSKKGSTNHTKYTGNTCSREHPWREKLMLMEYEPKLSDTNVYGESFTLFSRGLGEILPFHITFRKRRLTSEVRPIPIKTVAATEKKITFPKRPLEGRSYEKKPLFIALVSKWSVWGEDSIQPPF